MRVGLNPYGLTWMLGSQGHGTLASQPRRPRPRGLPRHRRRARARRCWRSSIPGCRRFRTRTSPTSARGSPTAGMTPVVSAGIDMMGPMESAFRSARLLGARTIRLGLSPVLCGDRNAWGREVGRARRPHPRGAGGMGAAGRRRRLPLRHREPPGLHQRRAGGVLRELPRGGDHARHRQHLPRRRGAARLHPPRRAAHRPHPPQGLPGAVHRGGLPPRPLRHRRRGGAPGRDAAHPRGRQPRGHRGAGARRAGGAARPALHLGLVERLRAEDGGGVRGLPAGGAA